MRVIVITDGDGYVYVVEQSLYNMRALLVRVMEYNKITTCLRDLERAKALLSDQTLPIEGSTMIGMIERYLDDEYCVGRTSGNMIDFVDVRLEFPDIRFD